MSCFLCTPRHIAILAHYAVREGLAPDLASAAAILAEGNIRSVAARYPDTAGRETEAFLSMTRHDFLAECAIEPQDIPGPASAAVLADSYDYQSCEAPDWLDSPAHVLIAALGDRLARHPRDGSEPWTA